MTGNLIRSSSCRGRNEGKQMASTHKYLILEMPSETRRRGGGPDFAMKSLTLPALKLYPAELTAAELGKLTQRPNTIAAPAMPMRLLAPKRRGGAVAENGKSTWGLDAIGATESVYDGSGVCVAVLDTGIDPTHEAFAHLGKRLIMRNFTSEADTDGDGHGTHCAGTIFGHVVDGTRIGIASRVSKALVGKVLGRGATSVTVVDAIHWALEEGAHVISMSLGIDFAGYQAELVRDGWPADVATSRALVGYAQNTAVFSSIAQYMEARGALSGAPAILIAASGNESRREVDPSYVVDVAPPASGLGVMSVSAVGQTAKGFAVADFANGGASLSGPGVDIVSAKVGGGLEAMDGTSMAAPHVAGIAALWAQHMKTIHRPFTTEFLRSHVLTSVQSIPGADPVDVGGGLVRAPVVA